MAFGPLGIHHRGIRKDPGLVIRVFCSVELGSALLNKIVLLGEIRLLTFEVCNACSTDASTRCDIYPPLQRVGIPNLPQLIRYIKQITSLQGADRFTYLIVTLRLSSYNVRLTPEVNRYIVAYHAYGISAPARII